jgi:hypothetical protein
MASSTFQQEMSCECTAEQTIRDQCSCSSNAKIEKIDTIIENLNKKLNKTPADYSQSNISHFATSLNGTTTTATNSTGNMVKFQQPSKSLITSAVMNSEAINRNVEGPMSEAVSPSSSLTESHLNLNQAHLNTSALSSRSSSAISMPQHISLDPYQQHQSSPPTLKHNSNKSPIEQTLQNVSQSVNYNTLFTNSNYNTVNTNTITNLSPMTATHLNNITNTNTNNSPTNKTNISPQFLSNRSNYSPNSDDLKTLELQKSFASAINANYQPTIISGSNPSSKLTEIYAKNYTNSNINSNNIEQSSTNSIQSQSITAVSNNRSSYRINAPTSLAMTESHKPYPSLATSSLANRVMSKVALRSNGSSTNASSVSDSPISSRGSSASNNLQHNSDNSSPNFSHHMPNHMDYQYGNGGESGGDGDISPHLSDISNHSSNMSKKTVPSNITKSSFPSSATFNNSISTIKTSYPSYGYNQTSNKQNSYQPYSHLYNDYYDD